MTNLFLFVVPYLSSLAENNAKFAFDLSLAQPAFDGLRDRADIVKKMREIICNIFRGDFSVLLKHRISRFVNAQREVVLSEANPLFLEFQKISSKLSSNVVSQEDLAIVNDIAGRLFKEDLIARIHMVFKTYVSDTEMDFFLKVEGLTAQELHPWIFKRLALELVPQKMLIDELLSHSPAPTSILSQLVGSVEPISSGSKIKGNSSVDIVSNGPEEDANPAMLVNNDSDSQKGLPEMIAAVKNGVEGPVHHDSTLPFGSIYRESRTGRVLPGLFNELQYLMSRNVSGILPHTNQDEAPALSNCYFLNLTDKATQQVKVLINQHLSRDNSVLPHRMADAEKNLDQLKILCEFVVEVLGFLQKVDKNAEEYEGRLLGMRSRLEACVVGYQQWKATYAPVSMQKVKSPKAKSRKAWDFFGTTSFQVN
jgi:hypothetical protein